MHEVVHLIDQPTYDVEQIRAKTQRAMEQDGLVVEGKSVFVKPSFVYPARPPRNRCVNTQPEVVGGVVRALKALGAARIDVGEDCLVGPSENGFVAMGVLPLMRGFAEPCYLQDEPRVSVSVEGALIEDRFSMPRRLMDADVFVSLPKLKVNMHALVTLSAKNHIGLILQKDRLPHHNYDLHKKIADLYRTRVPDYVITDAILAGEGQGPMHATPRAMSLLLAGANGLAVDTVACELAGLDPTRDVEHLVLLHQLGLGPVSLDGISLDGAELLEQRRRALHRASTSFEDCADFVTVHAGKERACPEGCLGMIRGSLDRWSLRGQCQSIGGFTFIVGKPVDDVPDQLDPRRTFVIGDCAADHAGRGTYIPGCPIPPMALTYAFLKKGKHGPLFTRIRDLARGTFMHALGLRVR